jgi:hypothetical protein
LRNWQCQLPGRDHFTLMTAFCRFGHGSFRSGQRRYISLVSRSLACSA